MLLWHQELSEPVINNKKKTNHERDSNFNESSYFCSEGHMTQHINFSKLVWSQFQGSDTLESLLSKVAFESNVRKKLARIERILIVKVSFERRKIAKVFMTHVQHFFRKSLSKANFERKLSTVSLTLQLECGPMPNVMAALPNIGGALCSMPQSLADVHY